MNVTVLLIAAGLVAAGFLAQFIYWRTQKANKIRAAQLEAGAILDKAQKDAELQTKQAMLKAKDEWFNAKTKFDKELRRRQGEFDARMAQLKQREVSVGKNDAFIKQKEQEIRNKEGYLANKEKAVRTRDEELDKLLAEQNRRLETVASMTATQAVEELKKNLEEQVRFESAHLIKKIKDEAKENAETEAKKIVVLAIQRCAAEHAVEHTVTTFTLPSDEVKGRIIGREGRNIRAFEEVTGVDVIVDDTPETIILSSYDPVKREVARMAMERLIQDGRIHPTRIEELVAKARKEVDRRVKEQGEQAILELDLHGVHPKLSEHMGILHYRTSYGQNILGHSKEVAILCSHMAAELGLDTKMAKRCGFLHDIGKSIDREQEGTHAQLGGDLAKKFGENDIVVNAIAGHHEDIEPISVFPILVQAADAISATRPGARMEAFSNYVRRVEELETIAGGFKGVNQVYALQAGREIRVIVNPEDVGDAESQEIATQIAKRVESQMEYPGQIKVTVIREKRLVDYAK